MFSWSPTLSLVSRSLSENSLDNYFRSPIWPPNISGSYVYQKLPIVQLRRGEDMLWRFMPTDSGQPRSGWAQPTVTQILWASAVFSSDSAPWELLAYQASPPFGLRRGEDVLWRFMSQHENLTRSLTVWHFRNLCAQLRIQVPNLNSFSS